MGYQNCGVEHEVQQKSAIGLLREPFWLRESTMSSLMVNRLPGLQIPTAGGRAH